MPELRQVTIHTDGCCLGNPGPGGYGVVLQYGAHRRELAGGYRLTTNNRMEIMAAIVGLNALKTACAVTLYSDSQYVVQAMTAGWATRWRANGWMRTKKDPALNADLWQQLLDAVAPHQVTFTWVRGHAGNTENERCDVLANAAARAPDLQIDAAYERTTAQAVKLSMAAPPGDAG